jgi:hypothetical protein
MITTNLVTLEVAANKALGFVEKTKPVGFIYTNIADIRERL